MKNTRNQTSGYGNMIPPSKEHVIIWFLQNNSTKELAIDFYKKYATQHWRNNKGIAIKDWKMRAWDWLWNNC